MDFTTQPHQIFVSAETVILRHTKAAKAEPRNYAYM